MRTYTSSHVYMSRGAARNVSPIKAAALVTALMVLIGGIFLAVGFGINKSSQHIKEVCTEEVNALVIDIRYDSSGLGSPVYRYDYGGKEYKAVTNAYSNDPPYDTGDTAKIMVAPDDPEKIYVPADNTSEFLGRIFMIVGGAMAGIGAAVFIIVSAAVKSGRKQQMQKNEPWQM